MTRATATLLCALFTISQYAYAASQVSGANYGSFIATLDRPLSSATAQVGDKFTLTTTDAVKDSAGKTVIPAKSKVTGQVTEVQAKKRASFVGSRQAKLNFKFVSVKIGAKDVPLAATLQGVMEPGATKSKVKTNEEGEVQAKQDTKKSAMKLGGGSAAGLIVGAATGHLLAGFLIGTIAGGGWVTASKGRDVELPTGTQFQLKLDQPVGTRH